LLVSGLQSPPPSLLQGSPSSGRVPRRHLSSKASNDNFLSLEIHQTSNHTRTQSRDTTVETTLPGRPCTPSLGHNQLSSHSDIKLPPSMKSRGSSKSLVDDEETLTGIRYPPSWRQNQPLSLQGTSRKMSESYHPTISHYGNPLTSLYPPRANIVVSSAS